MCEKTMGCDRGEDSEGFWERIVGCERWEESEGVCEKAVGCGRGGEVMECVRRLWAAREGRVYCTIECADVCSCCEEWVMFVSVVRGLSSWMSLLMLGCGWVFWLVVFRLCVRVVSWLMSESNLCCE